MAGTPMAKKAKKLKPSISINIVVLEDGKVAITGHPTNLMMCLDILSAAEKAVIAQYIQLAKEDLLTDSYDVKQSKIIQAKASLFGPDGKKVN